MTVKRSVGEPSAQTTKRAQTTTTAPSVEVIRQKLKADTSRSGAAFSAFSRGGMMSFPHADYITTHADSHAYVGVGVIGSLLLTVLGCMIFQYCKNKQREHVTQDSERRGIGTVTSDTQQAYHNEQEDLAHEVGEQHSVMSSSSEEGEHRQLTASAGAAQVARYCLIPDSPAFPLNIADTVGETNYPDRVGEAKSTGEDILKSDANKDLDKVDTIQSRESPAFSLSITDTVGEKNVPDRVGEAKSTGEDILKSDANRNLDKVDTVQSRVNTSDAVITVTQHDDDEVDIGNTHDQTNSSDQASVKQTVHSDIRHCEDQASGTSPAQELPSQMDTASDVSGYLATMVMDVSSEHSDVTGDRTRSSSSRTTDDSCQSLESFSRLQEVKAQADFSPYHIAWSTPRFSQHPSLKPRHSQKSSAAKKLNLDGGGGKHCDTIPETVGEQSQSSTDSLEAKRDGQRSSEDIHGWVSRKPEDAWNRPVSADYRTPRPVFNKDRRRSLGTWRAASEDSAEQEQLPLLAYSVSEYRRSLKNIASEAGSTEDFKEAMSPEQSYSLPSAHSSSLQSAAFYSDMDACGMSLSIANVSPVYSAHNEEETLLNLTSDVPVNMDSTLADFPEITHSSVGECSAASVSASWNNKNDQNQDPTTASEDAQNNNKTVYGFDTSQSATETSLSSAKSLIQSSTSPSYIHSSGSEQFSSDPSPEQMHTLSNRYERVDVESGSAVSTSSGSKSPRSRAVGTMDIFKIPYPVHSTVLTTLAVPSWRKGADKTSLPRSVSSTAKPMVQGTLLDPGHRQLCRSRTSESISSSTHNLHQPMSLGSSSDVSVAGSSASRLSLQDPSFTWDNEFTASDCAHNDSLTWEDDPYLN